jgi:hypothetical protein
VARARRRWMREQGMFDPARLVCPRLAGISGGSGGELSLEAQPGRTIVAPAGGQRCRVKGVYRPATGSTKAEMRARNWSFDQLRATSILSRLRIPRPQFHASSSLSKPASRAALASIQSAISRFSAQ